MILGGFNWPDWRRQSPLREAFRDGSTIDLAALSFADAARLITAIVRSDRFSDGALTARLDDGSPLTLLGIIRRWRPAAHDLT